MKRIQKRDQFMHGKMRDLVTIMNEPKGKGKMKNAGKKPPSNYGEKRYGSQTDMSKITGMSPSFWVNDRYLFHGKPPGIPFLKIGRTVRYEINEALAAFEARGCKSRNQLLEAKENGHELSDQQARTEF